MKKYMNITKNMKYWIILVTVLAFALITAFWTANWRPPPPESWARRAPRIVPGDMELYYTLKSVISTINVTLAFFLLAIYVDIYRKTSSEFTIGLIVFSIVILLNAITSHPLVHRIFGFWAVGLGPFAMLPELFTLIALIVLLYLSFKY